MRTAAPDNTFANRIFFFFFQNTRFKAHSKKARQIEQIGWLRGII